MELQSTNVTTKQWASVLMTCTLYQRFPVQGEILLKGEFQEYGEELQPQIGRHKLFE